MAVVVFARSKPFDASVSEARPAPAATCTGNIDGDTAASSASRREAATSTESSQPRTRRTSASATVTDAWSAADHFTPRTDWTAATIDTTTHPLSYELE